MGDLISRNPIVWFFIACFLGSLFLLGWLLKPFLSIIVLGAVLSGLFYPVFRLIQSHPKIRSSFASFLTCLLIFFILFVPIVFFVSSLAQQAFGLYQMARGAEVSEQINSLLKESMILDRANAYLSSFDIELTGDELKSVATEMIRFVAFYLYEQSKAIASNTLAFVINFFFMLMVIYFLFIDGQRLIDYIVDLSPLPLDQENELIGKFRQMARAILVGNGLGGVIQGGIGGLLFWFFGFPSAFLWGVIMGLLAFLPIIGISVVLVPTSIYLILKGRIAAGLFFLMFYVVVSTGTEYFFKPKLVGKQVQMHPLLVFFSIIGGLKLFGILGIIYGPLVVTAFLTLAEIYRSNYQQLVEEKRSE
jgi:predicted PurR-regulated permease PerM